MPKEVVPGEHYIVKDLPIYQASKEADVEKRRASGQSGEEEKRRNPSQGSRTETRRRLSSKENSSKKEEAGEEWEGVREPTPPMEFAPPLIIHEAEVMIEEPVNPLLIHLKRSGHIAGLNHSSTSWQRLPVRQIWLRKLRRQPSGLPTSGVMQLKPFARTPMEEAGAESQSQPSDDPDRLALVLVTGPPSKSLARCAI
ncbi:hypothetical protein CK203_013095 [Vitis vinifera]|uniref:Uncharacterized protein n=1 Tax=Vitis vinifera TaxID=29760 RepID=A0A438JLP5_VITVI|nr:hypothetical protein CK203_013095 [Vitis vinifera]